MGELRKRKIIISGGFGFIGKNLIERLYKKFRIAVIDIFRDEEFARRHPGIRYYKADLRKGTKLRGIIEKEQPDFIINLISIVTARRDISLFEQMIDTNIRVLLNYFKVLNKYEKLKLFINFGSAEEYGNIPPPFRENDKEIPNSPYSIVKHMTTNTCMMLNKAYNFPVCVLRPGNVFGRYQDKAKFVPYIIDRLRKNRDIHMTEGKQKRDFIYADDLAFAVEKILRNYKKCAGEIINVSYGGSISLKDLVRYFKKKLESGSDIYFGSVPYREDEIMDFRCDVVKLEKTAGVKFHKDNILNAINKYITSMRIENLI
ncbi:MAG: NAD-dependent epimerase/dehydratase family protein [Elusimicrobiota bacterium]